MVEYTFSWAFPSTEVHPSLDGQSDVIRAIHWRYFASDGVNTADTYGEVTLKPPAEGSPFIPFDKLDEETIVKWLTSPSGDDGPVINLADLQERLKDQLKAITAPETVSKALPFANVGDTASVAPSISQGVPPAKWL